MIKKTAEVFGLLAVGTTVGVFVAHTAMAMFKPAYPEDVYNQMVEAFQQAAADQAKERAERARALKDHHAKQRARALEILPIFKMEMAGMRMQTQAFGQQLTVSPLECAKARDANTTFTELDGQLAAFDEQVEAKQREGSVLRSATERAEHKQLLKNQQQVIEKRCAMFFN